MLVDQNDDMFVIGITEGALNNQTHVGERDLFVIKVYNTIKLHEKWTFYLQSIKYTNDGELSWTQQFGTSVHDDFVAAEIDAQSNIYLVGHTEGVMGSEKRKEG